MSTQSPDSADEPRTAPPEAPLTGHPRVDEALAAVGDLGGVPIGDHHARLARAHETLHGVLDEATRPRP